MVKARAAARRGSLYHIPAFGTFAGVTDGDAGDTDIQITPRWLVLHGKIPYSTSKEESHVFDYDIPMSRIDARIPLSVRETIDRAAAMQGRTRTDFLIAAALEKAEQVIAEQSLVRLALEDQRTLAAALLSEKTEAPPSFLEKLSSEYAQRVESR